MTTRLPTADEMRHAAELAEKVHPSVLATALGMALMARGQVADAYALSQIAARCLPLPGSDPQRN